MQSQRQQKYARQIQKDLGEIFQKDPKHFFGNSLVTLTSVEVSPDLSFTKLFMSVFPIKDAEEVFFRLNENKSEVRKLLGNKIGKRVRIVPEIAFFHDDTEEKASRIDKLIDNLNIPPAPEKEN
ncbi:MAG: 30S ribosome-binding factor RbfA [Cyclobacteriaceae bacterium]